MRRPPIYLGYLGLLIALSILLPMGANAEETAPKKRKKLQRVVVYELKSTDMEDEHLEMVSASFLTEVRKLAGISAIGLDEVQAMLSDQEQKQMQSCNDDSCMAAVAGALGADMVLVGTVGSVGASTVFNVKRINMKTAMVDYSFNKRMRGGTGEEMLEAVGPSVAQLFPDFELRTGLSRGVPAQLVARWNPPPLKPWMTLVTAGGAGVFALTAIFFSISKTMAESNYEDLNSQSTVHSVAGKRLVEYETQANTGYRNTLIFAPLSLGGLVASGVMYLFTDWEGENADVAQVDVSADGATLSFILHF
ncbi:hypothetical protein KAI87_03950 [Myxococcota bacterium]|nr:hypothetical protein [Myxococcota bacterium]